MTTPSLSDRAHRQFRLVRDAELADDDDVEWSVDRLGDSCGDGNAAAGQTEHDGMVEFGLRHLDAQQCAR